MLRWIGLALLGILIAAAISIAASRGSPASRSAWPHSRSRRATRWLRRGKSGRRPGTPRRSDAGKPSKPTARHPRLRTRLPNRPNRRPRTRATRTDSLIPGIEPASPAQPDDSGGSGGGDHGAAAPTTELGAHPDQSPGAGTRRPAAGARSHGERARPSSASRRCGRLKRSQRETPRGRVETITSSN